MEYPELEQTPKDHQNPSSGFPKIHLGSFSWQGFFLPEGTEQKFCHNKDFTFQGGVV